MSKANIIEGTYTSVWEGEGEITARANINLDTKEVDILESFDPADCYTEDGEPFECEILEDEYVTINGEKYPCHRLYDDWNNEKWTADKGFFYK